MSVVQQMCIDLGMSYDFFVATEGPNKKVMYGDLR